VKEPTIFFSEETFAELFFKELIFFDLAYIPKNYFENKIEKGINYFKNFKK